MKARLRVRVFLTSMFELPSDLVTMAHQPINTRLPTSFIHSWKSRDKKRHDTTRTNDSPISVGCGQHIKIYITAVVSIRRRIGKFDKESHEAYEVITIVGIGP